MHTISIEQLAQQMHARKERGEKPYVLFLGAGISISPGVSDMDNLIKNFLVDSGQVKAEKIDEMSKGERFEKFVVAMEYLDEIDRYVWLEAGFKNHTSLSGYSALTQLIEEGYFDLILTTNWDEFLDISLEKSNRLKKGYDFRVYVRGVADNDFIIRSFKVFSEPRVKVLKLHGELESRTIFVTPSETRRFPDDLENLLIDLFRTRSLMMIGYSVPDMDVKKCIMARAKPNEKTDNALVYINPYPRNDKSFLAITRKFKHAQQLAGPDAEFETFMKKLSDAIFKLSGGVVEKEQNKTIDNKIVLDVLNTMGNKLEKLEQELIELKVFFKKPKGDFKKSEFKNNLSRKSSQNPQVFISYAREDKEKAQNLYRELNKRKIHIWFDEKSLWPGQKWEPIIKQAIVDSRFFLALLSSNSISKKGNVQKELKIALDLLDKFPEQDIFIIPVRLEECEPSDPRLGQLQWVDLFPSWEEGITKIFRSIQSEMKK